MQVISRIVGREHLLGMLGIADDLVKVDYSIEVAWRPDPRVNGLAVGFAAGTGMIVLRAGIRKNGAAENVDSVCVSPRDDLLVGCDDASNHQLVLFR